MKIKPGKYTDLSNEDYHAHSDSISRSAIMDFAKSPKTYWANYLSFKKILRDSTPAMIFGELFHKLILEPERFERDHCAYYTQTTVIPTVGLLKNIGREEYEKQKLEKLSAEEKENKIFLDWLNKNKNKTSVKPLDYYKLMHMKESIQSNEYAWELLTGGINESSYFWNDEETGTLLKARPDVLYESVCVDLKTCKDASPRAFQRAMVDGGYHIQAAMIIDAVKAIDNRKIYNFINVAIEKEYPYSIGVYILDDAAIDAGREKYKNILKEMKIAREKNEWSDYPTQVIGLPGWYE